MVMINISESNRRYRRHNISSTFRRLLSTVGFSRVYLQAHTTMQIIQNGP